MKVTVNEGDTLRTIAAARTLDEAYAPAIAEVNGIYEDDGVTPYDIDKTIPPWLFPELEIPDNWIKQTTNFWLYVAIVGLLGFAMRT